MSNDEPVLMSTTTMFGPDGEEIMVAASISRPVAIQWRVDGELVERTNTAMGGIGYVAKVPMAEGRHVRPTADVGQRNVFVLDDEGRVCGDRVAHDMVYLLVDRDVIVNVETEPCDCEPRP